MKRKFNSLISFSILFFLSLCFTSCLQANNTEDFAKRVDIYDHGINMQISTYQLPYGWKVDHRIVTATQDYTRFFKSYKFDFLGPKKEVIRNVAPVSFCPYLGESVDEVWHQTMVQQLQPFGKFSTGPLLKGYYGKSLFPELANYPGIKLIESHVSGYRNGRAFEGVCIGFLSYGDYASQLNALIILSPKGQLQNTMKTYLVIRQSKQENRQYTQYITRLNQQKIQYYLKNQKTIKDQRERHFNEWQERNREAVAAYSAANRSFNDYLKGNYSGGNSNRNGAYSTQDAFNDHVKGTTSFDDSYLGYRVAKQGNYNYWYTDGYGNYYGTNDPGFDPNTLNGSWRRAQPVRQ